MRYILDANALIYLVKSGLSQDFLKLLDDNVVIDSSVYEEVIEKGISNDYPDAYKAKEFIEKNQIPIISVDLSSDLSKFRDPGETSCFILAKSEGVCISSDIRANKKFESFKIPYMQLDTFFYNQFLKKKIDKYIFIDFLNNLKKVDGTSANRISVFLELLTKVGEKNE